MCRNNSDKRSYPVNKTRSTLSHLRIALCAGIAPLFIFPESAMAWTRPGHEIIAIIAQNRLSATALGKIRDIIGPDTPLARIANCADDVKKGDITCGGAFSMKSRPSSTGWHFINIPTDDSPTVADLDEYCSFEEEKNGCVTALIAKNASLLSDPAAAIEQKQEALAFVVHLLGDIHQPLHCAAEHEDDGSDDWGGVKKPVLVEQPSGNARTNLHLLWDNMIKTNSGAKAVNPQEAAEALERDLEKKDTQSWMTGDFIASAALESFKIAQKNIYPSYHQENGQVIGYAYKKEMKPVVEERLQKAGARLAYLLDQELGK